MQLRRYVGWSTANSSEALASAHRKVNELKAVARLIQGDHAEHETELDRTQREAAEHRARRADVTAKLKERDRLLDQIQHSVSWKVVKPVWKLFNRSRRNANSDTLSPDLTFAVDLPKSWTVKRRVLLIKGWCLSRSGRQLAGVRVMIGRKARFAEYGLERKDLADIFPEHPTAIRSGFVVVIKVPPGESTLRFEAIEHGSQWETFFHTRLYREPSPDEEEEEQLEAPVVERITVLPSLSSSKAFELVKEGLERHGQRVTSAVPRFSV